MMVKPASQGSSVGITKVKAAGELARAFEEARAIDPIVFAERFIAGDEYTVGDAQGQALPSIRIVPATEFYDYQAKYSATTRNITVRAVFAAPPRRSCSAAALATFRVTDCPGWGRVDFMRDSADGKFYFIEINTTPGMTDHSLVPMAARQLGIDFEELVWRVLETSFYGSAKLRTTHDSQLAEPPQPVQEPRQAAAKSGRQLAADSRSSGAAMRARRAVLAARRGSLGGAQPGRSTGRCA